MKLTVASSPHIRGDFRSSRLMLDVVIGLVPATLVGCFVLGWRCLTVVVLSMACAILTEWLYALVTKKRNTLPDCSALVTGMLFALTLPATVPYYVVILGSVSAILFVKLMCGGLGQNNRYAEGDTDFITDCIKAAHRTRFGNRRHQADSHCRRKNCCQINQRYSHTCQITEQLSRMMNIKTGCFQTLRHNQKVQICTYRQHQTGQRNRQSQLQQTLDDMSGTFYRRTVILLCHFLLQALLQAAIEPHQHQKCTERAYTGTHAGTACSERQTVRHKEVGKNEHVFWLTMLTGCWV